MSTEPTDKATFERNRKRAEVEHNFTFHPPQPGQPEVYTEIREHAKLLAHLILDLTPASREQSLALTKLEECVMWSNAAVARNGE